MTKTTAKPETLGIPELAASLAEAHDLTKARAKAMMDGLRDDIVENLLAGKRVNIFGLGTFMWHTSDLDLPLTYLYEKHK